MTQKTASASGYRSKLKAGVFAAGSSVFRVVGSVSAGVRPLPDFLLIGTKRGGTTSLFYDILKLPRVIPMFPSAPYLPKANETKGVHFFDSNYAKGLRWYRSYMPTSGARRRAEKRLGGSVLVGEASPYYLFHPLAAARAHAAVPDAKLIVLLRDPALRTYSHWKERRRSDAEPLEFGEALAAEAGRLEGEEQRLLADPRYYSYAHEQQSYVAQSRYAPALRRWVDLFGIDKILVIASEEYYADQNGTITRIASFLGVDASGIRADSRMNAAAGGGLDSAAEAELRATFAPDNAELERMIGRDLPWL